MLGPAHTLVEIESEIDYTPSGDSCPIYLIVSTKTNTSDVIIETLTGSTATWPAGSLVAGAKYDIFIKTITWTGTDAGFIGFKLGKMPFGLLID